MRAALLALDAGADGIKLHRREDRRHIREDDLRRLQEAVTAPVNLEMAATGEMVRIALASRSHAVCLVPERREEVTTEGGLDAAGSLVAHLVGAGLVGAGIRVSLFIDPEERQVRAAAGSGRPSSSCRRADMRRRREAAAPANSTGWQALPRLRRAAASSACRAWPDVRQRGGRRGICLKWPN